MPSTRREISDHCRHLRCVDDLGLAFPASTQRALPCFFIMLTYFIDHLLATADLLYFSVSLQSSSLVFYTHFYICHNLVISLTKHERPPPNDKNPACFPRTKDHRNSLTLSDTYTFKSNT